MDDLRFNLQNIWSLRNENGDSISLSPFNGRVSLVVFKKGSSKPDVKMPVSTAYSLRWTAIAKELMMATPGIKIPFVQMRYDPQAKQTVKELTIVFAKDEKGCYYLEVQSPKMSPDISLKCYLHSVLDSNRVVSVTRVVIETLVTVVMVAVTAMEISRNHQHLLIHSVM